MAGVACRDCGVCVVANDIGMAICRSTVVSILPCLVAIFGISSHSMSVVVFLGGGGE